MNSGSNKNELLSISAEQIWKKLIRLTEKVGTDEAKSISVLVYLLVVANRKSAFWERFKGRAKFFQRQPLPAGSFAPPPHKGGALFAFLYDTPANTNNLLPVLQAAQRHGKQLHILTGERVNLNHLGLNTADSSISVTELMALCPLKERLRALATARKNFVALCEECAKEVPQWKNIIWAHRASLIGELALAIIARHGLRQLYAAWEPRYLVTTSNLWPFDQAMFMEAQRFKIPSFVIQHGTTSHYWWPFDASKMLLWGKAFEHELLDLGVPNGRLEVCGMPATDHLFSRLKGDNSPGTRRNTANSFVFLSHMHGRLYEPEPYTRFKVLFQAVVKATPEIQWKVKLHPAEDQSFYKEMLDEYLPNFSILPKSVTLEEAVRQSDVACTLWSTSGIEALMMHRPLVVFDVAPIVREYAWWPKTGGGTYVATLEDVLKYVKQASSNASFFAGLLDRQSQFITNNFANPGCAADACLDSIEKVVNARSAVQSSNCAGTQVSRELEVVK